MEWLVRADNLNVTNTGLLEKRNGFTLSKAGSYSSAYGTLDFQHLFLVDGLALKNYEGSTLAALSSTAPMHWAEINGQVFFSNGTNCGIINLDNSLMEWRWEIPSQPRVTPVTGSLPSGLYQVLCTYLLADGRETGPSDPFEIVLSEGQALSISNIPHIAGAQTRIYIAPANSSVYQLASTTTGSAMVWNFSNDALGEDMKTDGLDPLPSGVSYIQFFKGRVYAAQYMPKADQTVVWYSKPLGFHLFALNSDFFIVPGEVTMLAPTDDALIVGTSKRTHAYNGESLSELADYGVIPGQHWANDDKRILFWTTRGVCSALPFTNLTEKSVSVAPGIKAGGTIVQQGGQKRYLVALQQGGSAFNSY